MATQKEKLERFLKYILDGRHKSGLIGLKSHRLIAAELGVSTWFVQKHLLAEHPDIERRMRYLRSR